MGRGRGRDGWSGERDGGAGDARADGVVGCGEGGRLGHVDVDVVVVAGGGATTAAGIYARYPSGPHLYYLPTHHLSLTLPPCARIHCLEITTVGMNLLCDVDRTGQFQSIA